MYQTKVLLSFVFLVLIINHAFGLFFDSEKTVAGVRKAPRWNISWLGIGMSCNGCPPVGCEQDEAVIHGFCCGCARPLDRLPVLCPDFLQCPLNLHGLDTITNTCCGVAVNAKDYK